MLCVNCKKEIKDSAAFCPYCGTKQVLEPTEGTTAQSTEPTEGTPVPPAKAEANPETKPKKKTGLIIGVIVVLILLAVAAGLLFFLRGSGEDTDGRDRDRKETEAEDEGAGESTEEASTDSSEEASAESSEEAVIEEVIEPEEGDYPLEILTAGLTLTPFYSGVQPGVIDLNARNVTPGTKSQGMVWDSSLFYWLEDCDTTSDEDGYIANCFITKTRLVTADTGELIQFEIYREPNSGQIYKIVSIKLLESGVELTDYYYQDGRPNFVFIRKDNVYTPTYATIDKVGDRYYFNEDVMVRWRMITVPGEVGEYVLTPDDVWYSQGDYYAESDELRQIYDEKEAEILNRAYNVWNAVTASGEIGIVEGMVKNAEGTPVENAVLNIFRKEDNELLYQMLTGAEGRFSGYVHLNDAEECFMIASVQDGAYKPLAVSDLRLSNRTDLYRYDPLVLHRVGEEDILLRLYAGIADEFVCQEDGTLNRTVPTGVSVNIREGMGNRTGRVIRTVESSGNSDFAVSLPAGVYTAEFQANGYANSYVDVEVNGAESSCTGWMIPAPAQGRTAVVLTWEGENEDLDLTVFTPYQADRGDMAYIGSGVPADAQGNYLVSDNEAYCEVMYLNTWNVGSYKVFVNDYANSSTGNYYADRLAALDVHVYIYNENGCVAAYDFPKGQNGVVWEVAEINQNNVIPGQRVYCEIEGKDWWLKGKQGRSAEELLEALANNLGSYIRNGGETSPSGMVEYFRALCEDAPSIAGYFHPDAMSFYPEDIIEWNENGGYITEENFNRMIYSLSGRRDLKVDDLRQIYDYICVSEVRDGVNYYLVYDWAGYMGEWTELVNPIVSTAGPKKWDVTYEAIFYEWDEELCDNAEGYNAGNITFHIVEDAGSVFDGYRITGVEFSGEEGSVENDGEGIAGGGDGSGAEEFADNSGNGSWQQAYAEQVKLCEQKHKGSVYDLLYLDDNDVPELIVGETEIYVYTFDNGKLYTLINGWANDFDKADNGVGDEVTYQEGSGCIQRCMYLEERNVFENYRIENHALVTDSDYDEVFEHLLRGRMSAAKVVERMDSGDF